MDLAVLLPVKDFRQAKARLAATVDPGDRAALARWMADRVVAASHCPVFVVCDSHEVSEWAESRGATVLWTPGIGLNAAASDGLTAIRDAGFDHVVVAHSDLPLAADITRVARADAVTLVPDLRSDGTNVLALPASVDFHFAYGPGSFAAHLAETERLGLRSVVDRDERLAIDVDTSEDMCHPLIAPLIREVLPSWTPPTSPVSHR